MPIYDFTRILTTKGKFSPQEKTITEIWQATSSTPIFDASVELDPFLPAILSPQKQHPEMRLVDVDFMEQDVKVPNMQMVVQRYSNRWTLGDGSNLNGGQFDPEPNPNKEDAIINRGFWTDTKVFEVDLDNLPITTTAGEQIFHQEEVEYQSWTIQKNVPKYPAIFGSPKNGSRMFINSDRVVFDGETWDKETLLIRQITCGTIGVKNNFFYFPLQFQVLFNPDTWATIKRNAGFVALTPVQIQVNRFLKKWVMKPMPIKVGIPAAYPSQPIPLQNEPGNPLTHGRPFPEFISTNPVDHPTGYTDKAEISPARLKEIWKLTKLTFRTKESIKFTGNVPLK